MVQVTRVRVCMPPRAINERTCAPLDVRDMDTCTSKSSKGTLEGHTVDTSASAACTNTKQW